MRIVTILAIVAALVWWQWPTIAGHDGRTDVVLISDGFLTSKQLPVSNRIHEDGRSLRWDEGAATSWCNAADAVSRAVDEFDPAAVVLSFSDATGCDATAVTDAVQAARGHSVVIVTQPGGSGVETAGAHGAALVDPTRYIGDQLAATSMPCQWWDICADGEVQVRTADGQLTSEGSDRVARMIVAELP